MANLSYYDGGNWITLSNIAVSMVGGGASIKKLRTETVVAQNTFAAGDTAHIISATGTVTPEINAVSTLPAGAGNGAAFNHDGTRCAIAHITSPYVTIYDTTTSPWTKIANPSTLPTGNGYCAAFNHDGTRCAITHDTSPFVTIYDFIYNTPFAFNANNTVTSRECSYGYATAAITSGSTGTIDVIFD